MSSRTKNIIAILSMVIILFISLLFTILVINMDNSDEEVNNTLDWEWSNPDYKIEDIIDSGTVDVSNKITLTQEEIAKMFESVELKPVPSDINDTTFDWIEYNDDFDMQPPVTWVSGALSSDDLEIMSNVACSAISKYMQEHGYGRVNVEHSLPTYDELQLFKSPIYYFADNNTGRLTLNMKLIITKYSDGSQVTVLTPVTLEWFCGIIVLVE